METNVKRSVNIMIKKISWVSTIISLAFALVLTFLSDKRTFKLNLSNNLFLIGLFILVIALVLYLYDAHIFRHLTWHRPQTPTVSQKDTKQPAFYTKLRRVFLWLGLIEMAASIVISFL